MLDQIILSNGNLTYLSGELSVGSTGHNMMYEFTRTHIAQRAIIALAYRHYDKDDLLQKVAKYMNMLFVKRSSSAKRGYSVSLDTAKTQNCTRGALKGLPGFESLQSLKNRMSRKPIPINVDQLDFGSDSEAELESENNNIYCKKITLASGMNAIMTLHDNNLDQYFSGTTVSGHVYYEYEDLVRLTGKRRAIIDLNPCVNTLVWGRQKLNNIPEKTILSADIFDVTSSTTDEIAKILNLRHLKTITVFVRSGTKHGSGGLDINAFGEIRVFTRNKGILQAMVNCILNSKYAVPVGQTSHAIRRYDLEQYGGLTNMAILKMCKGQRVSTRRHPEHIKKEMFSIIGLIGGSDTKAANLQMQLKAVVLAVVSQLILDPEDKKAKELLHHLVKSLGLTGTPSMGASKNNPVNYNYDDYMPLPSNEKKIFYSMFPDFVICDVSPHDNNCLIHALLRCTTNFSPEQIIAAGERIRMQLIAEDRTVPGAFLYMYYHAKRILELIRDFYLSTLDPDHFTIREYWTYNGEMQPPDEIGNGKINLSLWNSGGHYQTIHHKSQN